MARTDRAVALRVNRIVFPVIWRRRSRTTTIIKRLSRRRRRRRVRRRLLREKPPARRVLTGRRALYSLARVAPLLIPPSWSRRTRVRIPLTTGRCGHLLFADDKPNVFPAPRVTNGQRSFYFLTVLNRS